ncbi:SRPBCC family protein [Cytobacillus sp.]|uniref:SRPBCC family protein n=1 Tax=Cytobacillus sp. TaxID=2675269 RepID=UPI0028BE58F9|nr:SRPBCC family protein [Cytobacillus sp.]
MQAVIESVECGYHAIFERRLNYGVNQVWAMLTENEKLTTWFSELKVDELRKGGYIKFDMGDGTFEKMEILELTEEAVLEYTWGEAIVRFELAEESEGCKLVLIEKINKLTDHTPRDLAGWHVCLDVIGRLLDGKEVRSRKAKWQKWYEHYVKALAVLQ